MNQTIWHKLQNINPRILYVITIFVIAAPLCIPRLALPIKPGIQTMQAYNTVEAIGHAQPVKLALIDGEWSSSSRGENQYQTEAIIEQLMRLRMPFALMTFEPQNRTLTQAICVSLAKKYNYVYGKDWVNFGYKVAPVQVLKGMSTDIVGTLKEDITHQKLGTLPIMHGVKTFKDIGLIVEITPASTLDLWLGLVQGQFHTPIIYAPTAVMAPEGYQFLDSHQISGIVTGVAGAGEYEEQLGVHGAGLQVATALSMVYGLIIVLIIAGNVGYFVMRNEERKARQ